MLQKLKNIARSLKDEVQVCKGLLRDPRTPWIAKLLLGLAVGYALSPIDLVPDFIPVIGHLDDVIIVPSIILVAMALVPREVISEHRARVAEKDPQG